MDLPESESRYARHLALPEIGQEGQAQLAEARVLVIGAGGLGAPALLYLAAAGIGTIGIVDDDRVDISNLQRQVLYTEADVGRVKVEAAAERLAALNADVRVAQQRTRLRTDNAVALMHGYDIVIDATDQLETKFLINDAAAVAGKPLVYGSALGFEAQVAIFEATRGPCLRCLFPEPPETPTLTCSQAGILGAVTGIAGSVQALEAIKWILTDGTGSDRLETLLGRLWLLDARTFRTRVVRLPADPACRLCRRPPETIRLPESDAPMEIAHGQLGEHPGALLIDVREAEEWADGHLGGAIHLPLSRLLSEAPRLPERKTYITYCAHGFRSQTAARLLEEAGYSPVFSLAGGIAAVPEEAITDRGTGD